MATITDHGNYTEIALSAGENYQRTLGSGDRLENVLVDQTAQDADFHISASGSDWVVRNVGVYGKADIGNNTGGTPNIIRCSGTGLIEHCYFGDGVNDSGSGVRKGGIGVRKSHSGRLIIRECYIAEWTGNAMYAATCAEPGGGGGHVGVESCYFRDNTVSHLRIAQDNSYLQDTVVRNADNVPYHPGFGTTFSRGLWSYYGDTSQVVDVINCDIDITDSNSNGGGDAIVTVTSEPMSQFRLTGGTQVRGRNYDSSQIIYDDWGQSPDTSVPSSVPTGALAAAQGDSGGGGGGGDDGTTDPTTDPFERETFDHGDVAGNYSGDTSDFAISTDSAGDAYLHSAGGHDADSLIALDDYHVGAGNTYVSSLERRGDPDLGLLFGGQTSDMTRLTGYLVLFGASRTLLAQYDQMQVVDSTSAPAVPAGERVRVTVDYRDTADDTVGLAVAHDGQRIVDLSLSGATAYDQGSLGFYHWLDTDSRIYETVHEDAVADGTETLALTGTTSDTCEYVLDVVRASDAPSDVEFAVDYGNNADPSVTTEVDQISETSDGYRIHGYIGNGGIDDYLVDVGELAAGAFYGGSANVTMAGESVGVGALPAPENSPGTPAAPTNLRVASRGETQASLAWETSADAAETDYYTVYVDGSAATTTTTTSTTIDGLAAGTEYAVTVTAVNDHDSGAAESPPSNTVTVTTGTSATLSPRATAKGIATTSSGIYAARQIDGGATTLDGFERTSLGYSGGDTGAFDVTTAAAFEDSRALTRTSPDAPANAFIAATDPDPADGISQGDEFQFRVWSETGVTSDTSVQLGVMFGIDDPTAPGQNCYFITIRPAGNNHVGITRALDGDYQTLNTVEQIDYPGSEWWTIRGAWRQTNVLVAEVYDADGNSIGSTQVEDTTHSGVNGTVGWFGYLPADRAVYADALERL
jgi:hypothetical protein